jgi:hypothetical protein
MTNPSEPRPGQAERLQLRIAEALRGTSFVFEGASQAADRSCAVCGSELAGAAHASAAIPERVYCSMDRHAWVCNPCFTKFQRHANWRVESPYMRQLHAPITVEQLSPLDERCRIVQFRFAPDRPVTDSDLQLAAAFLRQYPEVPFRVYGRDVAIRDLEFLSYFTFVKSFQADLWDLDNLDGLRLLPSDLQRLAVGSTKSRRHSLRFLEHFPALKRLFLDGHSKDFEAVSQLGQLESLTLKSITLPDLSALTRLTRLKSLDIKLGGTKDLSLLPKIGKLRYLELWMVRGLTDLSAVGELDHLQYLFLQALKQVSALPSFRKLRSLRRVRLETMKGLYDLSGIREAPALEELIAVDMRHLTSEAFRPLAGHSTLRAALIGLGSAKKNKAAYALLNLPKVEGKFQFAPEDQDHPCAPSSSTHAPGS